MIRRAEPREMLGDDICFYMYPSADLPRMYYSDLIRMRDNAHRHRALLNTRDSKGNAIESDAAFYYHVTHEILGEGEGDLEAVPCGEYTRNPR